MNLIWESMKNIQATEKLKQNTLQYLNEQQRRKYRVRTRFVPSYALAVFGLLCLIGTAGGFVYSKPVSYISIDVNPSIELSVNRFGRVVYSETYSDEGKGITGQIPLKNVSYMQAINRLLNDDKYMKYLGKDSILVFTVISDRSEQILENLKSSKLLEKYSALTYTSDLSCMEEAHRHEMSFGKYRTYLELLEYDGSVTIEDCHEMTMGELRDRIDACAHGVQADNEKEHHGSGHHGKGNGCDN